MISMEDYYSTLEVRPEATAREIKSAYRRLAKIYHPDMVSESQKKVAEEKFKIIAEAYYVLNDLHRRSEYDSHRKAPAPKPTAEYATSRDFNVDDVLKYAEKAKKEIDRAEYAIRFGCGGVLGLAIGLSVAIRFYNEPRLFFLCLLLITGLFGLLSAVLGDRFWSIFGWFRPWR